MPSPLLVMVPLADAVVTLVMEGVAAGIAVALQQIGSIQEIGNIFCAVG